MVKNLDLELRAGHWTSNKEPRNGWDLEIRDSISGCFICEVTLTPEMFYNLMRGGSVTVPGIVMDVFEKLGMKREVKSVVLQDERLKGYESRNQDTFDAVIDDHRPTYEEEGWVIRRVKPSSLARDQHDSEAGTLAVTLDRYVPKEQDEPA